MTPEEKFLFDLNGYLVVRGAVSAEEILDMNALVDEHQSEAVARSSATLRNAKNDGAFGDEGARRDLGGMLRWHEGEPFRQLLAHPSLAPYLCGLLGEGYRLDHQPLVLLQNHGSEGFALHGGPLGPDFTPELQYRCVNGRPWNSLLAMAVHLVDAPPGAGGFCVVRGSHKLNFPVPSAMASGADRSFAEEFAVQPATKAGDVVFFSEATVHGAKPWRASHERRVALYRFAPATFAYGRGYLEAEWGIPAEVLAKCTPAQRAVLAPPYAPRLDRPLSNALATDPDSSRRHPDKLAHDKAVFKTDFF